MVMRRVRVLYIVSGLNTGGAEMMLWKLLKAIDRRRFEPVVMVLGELGRPHGLIEDLGVRVHSIKIREGFGGLLRGGIGLRVVKSEAPDLIQGWMYHGNIAATLYKALLGIKVPVLWGIRHTFYRWGDYPIKNRCLIKGGASLSRYVKRVIYNSKESLDRHIRIGYSVENGVVISNGFDCEGYKPSDARGRKNTRKRLNIPVDARVIGLIARWHPMKDHGTFLRSARILANRMANTKYVLVGRGMEESNRRLVRMIGSLNLADNVMLLGEREDIAEITACLDVATSTSAWGEGFSNTIGEAMACGIPCVATNIGDSARVLGKTGICVPAENPSAIAEAWERLLRLPESSRMTLGMRVETGFSIGSQ